MNTETLASASDSERLDWLAANYLNGLGFPRFSFNPFSTLWHAKLREAYPNGYWSRHFGNKGESNRWPTLRAAIDDAMAHT